MATPQDCSLNIREESTYGTYNAPTQALEFMTGDFDLEPTRYDGLGLKVNSRTALESRTIETSRTVSGQISLEATTVGISRLLDWAVGDSTITLVSGSTYQHNFYPGDTPASLTIQQGIPQTTAGTVDVYSYLGCMCSGFSFNIAKGGDEVAMLEFDVDGRQLDTAQSLAALTYPTIPAGGIYSFNMANFEYGGTLTAATTTAIASSSASNATDVSAFSIQVNNALNVDRRNFGSAGLKSKPIVGIRELTGTFTAEYEGTTYAADLAAGTTRSLLLTMTSAVALSSGFATLQVEIPAVKLLRGTPKPNAGDVVEVEYEFKAYQSASFTYPWRFILRTADTAL